MTPRTVYFDLETGGVEPESPDIQIAAVAVEDGSWRELETYEAKLQFDAKAASPEALKLNHYDAAVWQASAVLPSNAVAGFRAFLDRHKSQAMTSKRTGRPFRVARLAGHNAASFDMPRLQRLFHRYQVFLPADMRVRDTMQLALWYFDSSGYVVKPENYKLETLCRYFGIETGGAHDALADVRMTVAVARTLVGLIVGELKQGAC